MKREILNTDVKLLQKCCKELNIKLVSAESDKYVVLTDNNGNKDYIDLNFNIFKDYIEE